MIVTFKLKDQAKTTVYYVPIYINMVTNHVEMYTYLIDFGYLYSNNHITYRIPIRARSLTRTPTDIGIPFEPLNTPLEFDFTKLVSNNGVLDLEKSNVIGHVSLRTHGLADGEYKGKFIFCVDKRCDNGQGLTRVQYRYTIFKDPLNAKFKMHSFEIDAKNDFENTPPYMIQQLWLKNNLNTGIVIDDIT